MLQEDGTIAVLLEQFDINEKDDEDETGKYISPEYKKIKQVNGLLRARNLPTLTGDEVEFMIDPLAARLGNGDSSDDILQILAGVLTKVDFGTSEYNNYIDSLKNGIVCFNPKGDKIITKIEVNMDEDGKIIGMKAFTG
jgi:hypothetical protein